MKICFPMSKCEPHRKEEQEQEEEEEEGKKKRKKMHLNHGFSLTRGLGGLDYLARFILYC